MLLMRFILRSDYDKLMDADSYRAPVDPPVSYYFKTFPLKNWSHSHFFKYTGTLDLEQASLWYDNIIIIKYLSGSFVDEELFTRRKWQMHLMLIKRNIYTLKMKCILIL